ncbi:portal protein [Hydrogenophaga sp.]|uniref:portal protein n=1 Tax=Hydrogenophaga sp. TaxID=1904254 RepID=UPI002FC732CB
MAQTQEEKGKAVLKQFEKLKAIRQPLDQEYEACYDYTYPTLGAGFREGRDGVSNAQSTKAKQAKLFDSTATDSVRLLSSSTLSSLTPPNTRWFNLAPPMLDPDELDQEGKQWLEDSAAQIHVMIHASNYDSEAIEFMNHMMIAGMCGLYTELKGDKYHFETWPLNHLYCQETLNNGYIDTVYRAFQYTVEEAVIEFGLNALPQKMKDSYANDPHGTKMYKFVVAIRPRIKNGKQATGRTQKNLPWESLWVAECGTIVRESGFNEMPVTVPRWMRIPDTDYARGPVFDAIPDIKSLNKVRESMLQNMDMNIFGVYKVKDDGTVNPNNVVLGARRMISVNNMEDIQTLHSGGDISYALNQVAAMQSGIRRILLADQLGPTEKAIMTATEVQTRNNQVRQILGPIFARLQSEFLTHLVARCFGLAIRANLLPPVPQSIAQGSGEFEIAYRSPLARSQKMQDLQAIDELTSRLTNVAQVRPDVMDFINFDALPQKYADLLAVDPQLMNDEDAVKKIRYEREQAKKEQAQAAERIATAEATAKGAAQGPDPTNSLL